MQLKDPKLLARLMAIQNVSGRQLSKVAGWESHTYLQRLLRGDVNTLQPIPAILIAKHLEVPLESLFVPKSSSDYEQLVQENNPSRAS